MKEGRDLEFSNWDGRKERRKEEISSFQIRNERRKKGRDVEFTNLEERKEKRKRRQIYKFGIKKGRDLEFTMI